MMKDICKVMDDVAKLGSELDKAIKKHDAATEKCKELAKDVEFWKEKAYEMDKKNCELRSRNRELEKDCDARADVINYQRERIEKLEKELEKEKQRLHCKVEITPETCCQIDILAREIDKLEKENKNCKDMLDTQHEHIKRVEEENVELKNALEAANLKLKKQIGCLWFDILSNAPSDYPKNVYKKKSKEFKEILVRECFGRPYYEILYKEDGNMHVGYSSYKLDKVSEWLKEFFID